MQEPGSPLVPLDPSRFREMVEKQHVGPQQQPSGPSGPVSQPPTQLAQQPQSIPQQQYIQHQMSVPNQYFRESLTRTQSTSSVGSVESVASQPQVDMTPCGPASVGGHFQQQMSPQYSPQVAGAQQQRFWYPHTSPRPPYGPPLQQQQLMQHPQQPMTPQPVRTPQSVGPVNSPRAQFVGPPLTPGLQVMSPDLTHSSPGSGRSPMGSPVQSSSMPQSVMLPQHTGATMRTVAPQHQQQPSAAPYQHQQSPQYIRQQLPPAYPQFQQQPQQLQQPAPYGAYPPHHVVSAPQQMQGRPYAPVMRHGSMPQQANIAQQQQLMIGGRPRAVQQVPMMQRPPGAMPDGQMYPDGSYRPPTVQYAGQPLQHQTCVIPSQQHMVGQVPYGGQQGMPGHPAYSNVHPDGSPMHYMQPGMQQQRYGQPMPIQQQPVNQRMPMPYGSMQQQQYRPAPGPRPQQAYPGQDTGQQDLSQQQLHHQGVLYPGPAQQQQQQTPRPQLLHQQVLLRSPYQADISRPQTPYLPGQQQAVRQPLPPNVFQQSGQLVQQQQQQQEMKSQYFGHEPNVNVSPDMCLVGAVFLIVDYDRILDQKEVGDWRLVITMHGGEVETSYSAKCTHIICESVRHPVVQQAVKDGKRCVTAQWLNDCLLQKHLQPPWKAVHFPSQHGDNKPCKNKLFTVCGFDGNERSCLKQMIMAVGGRYTGYLSKHNNFLIAKCLEDVKVAKAVEWKIPILNVCWLTELFLGQNGVLQNINSPKYHQFVPRELLQQQHQDIIDPFRVDMSMLQPWMANLMVAWRVPVTFTNETWKNAVERKQKIENDDGKIFPHKKLKLSPAPEEAEIENRRRSLQIRSSNAPRICFTGLYAAEVDNLTKKALWLGAEVVVEVKDCTHLVASDLKRTQKLLDGISLGRYIVTPLWIRQSYKQHQFVDASEYVVKDEGNEKFFGFNIKLSTYRARQAKLFQSVMFYLTPSVQPYASVLREMIQTAGGSVLPQRPPTKKIMELQQQGAQLAIITCENDLHLCQSLLEAGIAIHSAEFVLTGILRQEVDFSSYKIEPRQNESAKANRDP